MTLRTFLVLLSTVLLSFAAGVVLAPSVSGLVSDDEPSCEGRMQELMGRLGNTGEVVRICHPPTWYQLPPAVMSRPGETTVTGIPPGIGAYRGHEIRVEERPGFVRVYTTQVYAFLNVIDPDTAKQMGGPPCTTDAPLQPLGDLTSCEDGYPLNGQDPSRNAIESVYFLTRDGYRIEGRAMIPYSHLTPRPITPEEYDGLQEQWPALLAEMQQIALDFASRANERRSLPMLPTATPSP